MRPLSLAIALAVLSPLQAATVFTDEATFQAALSPGFLNNTFSYAFDALQGSPLAFAGNGFTYEIATGDGSDLYESAFSGNLATGSSNRTFVITFTSGNIFGVGAYFLRSDAQETLLPAGSITVTLSDGTIETITSQGTVNYRGFTSNVAITSLTVSAGGAGVFNVLDNLTVGGVPASGVPEPSTSALLVSAGGLAFWMARRRRS